MSADQPTNPLRQQLDLLLTGYGYNFYNAKNTMRADDLLVRQKAADALGQAAATLAALQEAYQRRYAPPGTREQPFPPPECLEHLREIGYARERILTLAGDIRGMPVPTQDRTWWRYRGERALLGSLLEYDRALVGQSEQLAQQVQLLTANAWHSGEPYSVLEAQIAQLAMVIRDRRRLLQVPG
ncbi:MAG TPA: hypothetical protein VHB98_01625 [Chloroflexota bacterium]|nr:hypothetical protein [Chloroflexota bacterium]